MKTKIIITVLISGIFLFIASLASETIRQLTAERDRLKANQEQLILELIAQKNSYKILDSLSAVKVKALQLTISEYKALDTKNSQIIKTLLADKQDLQKVIDAQTITVNKLTAELKDVPVKDTILHVTDTIKCFEYNSKWLDLKGCLNLTQNKISIESKSRESLKAIETVTYKRFLGFLWKTKRIKSRDLNIISENPATTITNVDYVLISE